MKQQAIETLKEMERVVDRSLQQFSRKFEEALLKGDTEKLTRLQEAYAEHWGYRQSVREALYGSSSAD